MVVMLSGDEGEKADTTDADGAYSFPGLRRGEYTVSITNPDEAMYDFRGRTSQKVDLALGQAQTDVSFAGSMVQQSSISGQVTVEGAALAGVTVTLGGAGDDTRTTGDDGLYAFLNLGSGTYTVSMANPDSAAYSFDTEPVEVTLGNTDEQTHNFGGTHTREASISGMLFVDEGTKNDLHDDGEYPLAAEGVKVTLVGPTLLMRTRGRDGLDRRVCVRRAPPGLVPADVVVTRRRGDGRLRLRRRGELHHRCRCRCRRGRDAEPSVRHHAPDGQLHG